MAYQDGVYDRHVSDSQEVQEVGNEGSCDSQVEENGQPFPLNFEPRRIGEKPIGEGHKDNEKSSYGQGLKEVGLPVGELRQNRFSRPHELAKRTERTPVVFPFMGYFFVYS